MPALKVRADYEALGQIAAEFRRQAGIAGRMHLQLRLRKSILQNGHWVGKGADKFYAEMDSSVLPAIGRLVLALETASGVTGQIIQVMRDAEAEASRQMMRDVEAEADKQMIKEKAMELAEAAVDAKVDTAKHQIEIAMNLTRGVLDIGASVAAYAIGREMHQTEEDVSSLKSELGTLEQNLKDLKHEMEDAQQQEADIESRVGETDNARDAVRDNLAAAADAAGDVADAVGGIFRR